MAKLIPAPPMGKELYKKTFPRHLRGKGNPFMGEVENPAFVLNEFLKYKKLNPAPRPPENRPFPPDLKRVADAARLTNMSTFWIYKAIKRNLIRRWGHKGCYQVSLSEVMPETSPEPRHVMLCVMCDKEQVGRAGPANRWRSLQISERRFLYICPDHFPPPPWDSIPEITNTRIRDDVMSKYQLQCLFAWVDIIAHAVKRFTNIESEEDDKKNDHHRPVIVEHGQLHPAVVREDKHPG